MLIAFGGADVYKLPLDVLAEGAEAFKADLELSRRSRIRPTDSATQIV